MSISCQFSTADISCSASKATKVILPLTFKLNCPRRKHFDMCQYTSDNVSIIIIRKGGTAFRADINIITDVPSDNIIYFL
jgi:hypothetical protein